MSGVIRDTDLSIKKGDDMPSDSSEDNKASETDTEKHMGQFSETSIHKDALLEVAGLPEPGGAEKETLLSVATATNHTEGSKAVAEVQGSASKLANERQPATENTATACSEHGNQSNLEIASQGSPVSASSETGSESTKDAGQPTVPKTGFKDMKHLSPSSTNSAGSYEPPKYSQQLQSSSEDRSSLSGIGIARSIETTGFTETTGSTITASISSGGTATSDGSEEPVETSSKVGIHTVTVT